MTSSGSADHSHEPGDIAGEVHGPADHGDEHGHDDHAHPPEALGPVDRERWSAFVGGVLLGLVVVFCLVFTTNFA